MAQEELPSPVPRDHQAVEAEQEEDHRKEAEVVQGERQGCLLVSKAQIQRTLAEHREQNDQLLLKKHSSSERPVSVAVSALERTGSSERTF